VKFVKCDMEMGVRWLVFFGNGNVERDKKHVADGCPEGEKK
jgi:hypothetical protein